MTKKHFEFADFVEEFKVDFTYISESAGSYNDKGQWVPGTTTTTPMSGIVLPLTKDELQYVANGSYTSLDKKVYTTDPLSIGQTIKYKGQSYNVDRELPYQDYADVFIYYAKGVKS